MLLIGIVIILGEPLEVLSVCTPTFMTRERRDGSGLSVSSARRVQTERPTAVADHGRDGERWGDVCGAYLGARYSPMDPPSADPREPGSSLTTASRESSGEGERWAVSTSATSARASLSPYDLTRGAKGGRVRRACHVAPREVW